MSKIISLCLVLFALVGERCGVHCRSLANRHLAAQKAAALGHGPFIVCLR